MVRIFIGIVKCGAWGCFDEFNRLKEDQLSAISQQIQTIQDAIKLKSSPIHLLGKSIDVNFNSGIFVTLNPAGKGYGGRSRLPDNLKALFRPVAMGAPDNELIAEVSLVTEGFTESKDLASKIVSLFKLSKQLLSSQQHYDWGLRALKAVLNSGGRLIQNFKSNSNIVVDSKMEYEILIKAVRVNTLSKLTFGGTYVQLFIPFQGKNTLFFLEIPVMFIILVIISKFILLFYPILSCLGLFNLVLSILSNPIRSFTVLSPTLFQSSLILPYPTLPYPILSYLTILFLTLSYHTLSYSLPPSPLLSSPTDTSKFLALIGDVFPGVPSSDITGGELEEAIKEVIKEKPFFLVEDAAQIKKMIQLKESLDQRMGCVIVGPSGCGKSALWRVLKAAMIK